GPGRGPRGTVMLAAPAGPQYNHLSAVVARSFGRHERSHPMSRAATEYRYEKLTWPEINDAIEMRKVCILPCGAVEQHGPHLPLDVDIVCPTEIARGTGRLIPETLLVLPTVCYGYTQSIFLA